MPLGTPILTASTDPAGFVTLTLTATGATRGSIRRLTPTGTVPVRGMDNVDLSTGLVFTNDYEIPQSIELSYYATVTDGSTTNTTQILTVPGLNRGADWVAPFGTPLNGMAINVEGVDDLTYETKSDTAMVLNRRDPVVVNWGRNLPSGTIRFITLDDSERVQFTDILSTGRTVLFQPRISYGFEEPLFLAVGTVRERRTSTAGAEQSRIFECDVQLTGPPPPQFTIAVGITWQERVDAANNWNYWSTTSATSWRNFAGVA